MTKMPMSLAGRRLARRCSAFARDEHGVTTLEWVALAGVAAIMGVTLTYLSTHNFGATANFVESQVNEASAAASAVDQ